MGKWWFCDAALLMATIMWGANFVIIKITLSEVPPLLYLGLRFSLAFLLLLPWCWAPRRRPTIPAAWWQSLTAGLLLFSAFATQTIGLRDITPGMSGFLTGTYVIMVPLLGWAINRERPARSSLVGAVLAMVGVGLLSWQGALGIGRGDFLTLAGAVFFALHFLALGRWSAHIDTMFLTAAQMAVTGICSLAAALFFEPFTLQYSWRGWGAILYGAGLCSVGCYFIQTWAQRFIHPNRAAIWLSTETIFAVLFSIGAGMEALTIKKLLGFVSIFTGILIAEVFTAPEKTALSPAVSGDGSSVPPAK